MARAVEHSGLPGRKARVGSPEDQRRSTWDKLGEAIVTRDADAALELTEFALEGECRFIFDLLTGWADDLRQLLGERGVPEEALRAHTDRLARLLAFPDGKPYDPASGWQTVVEAVGRVTDAIGSGDWQAAAGAVAPACETWRTLHDRVIDSSYGWMSVWVERFGEESVPEMFELVAMEHFEEFFELGDPKRHAWIEGGCNAVLLDTLEAMRAHLSTVRRDGAPIEMVEHEDRYEFEFDPCGSGGRALRGDIVEGTPSRIGEPYNFGVIEGAYEWTDGKAGMCVYCNHCQQLYEQWTIDRSGIPFLVVDPPTAADGVGHDSPKRCRYTTYKDPDAVPDEVFERCGRSRRGPLA
jgi:hypothetical protein